MRRVLVAGALLGVLSRVEERVSGVSVGLSSDTMWLAAAFLAGASARSTPSGAPRGALILTVANLSYYGLIRATEPLYLLAVAGHPLRWFCLGVGGGAVAGAAGAAWCHAGPGMRVAAALVPASVAIADGADGLRGAPATHAVSVVAGVALALASARTPALRTAAAGLSLLLVVTSAHGAFTPLLP
jgi:Family of unknown function (DUF6518)